MASSLRNSALLGLFALRLSAQTPLQEVSIHTHPYTPPSAVLHAESNLVDVDVTVRDAHGHAIPGLEARDFEVLDNGAPQRITAFSELRSEGKSQAAPAAPRFVTFFFDDLHTGTLQMPFVKQAARAFALKYVRPGDRVSIATTSGLGELSFTGDAEVFAEKSGRLMTRTHQVRSVEEYHADSLSTLAALGSALEKLSQAPGSRILAFVSSGFIIHVGAEHDVESEVQKLADAAVRWNVVVQAIDAKGLSVGETWRLNRPLREISQGTGGHLFENSNDLAGSMELAANPEVTYLIAFNPGARDGNFHTLKVRFTTKREGSLEFRPGYLSRKDDEFDRKMAARAPLDEAVFSKATLQDVAAAVNLSGGSPKDGAIPVSVGITLDVNRLQFTHFHGRHMQQIVFLMTLLDANGGFIAGKESIMDLALTDEKLAALKRDGLKTVATLAAPAGIYQVRTVIREGMKGRLSASTAAVELRGK